MTTLDIADEIWREIGSPTDESVAGISFWLKTNVGQLNIALRKCFVLDSKSLEISPQLDENEKYIFKQMYNCYFYDKKVKSNLGAAAIGVTQVTQAGKTVKLTNRNEVSKVYAQLLKECKKDLAMLVADYRRGKFSPVQVTGNELSNLQVNPVTSAGNRIRGVI